MSTCSLGGDRATAWLAEDLTTLADQLGLGQASEPTPGEHHFDVVIVGSGYGGAMALYELAGYAAQDSGVNQGVRPLRIAMLERGSEYLPGMFPTRASDLPGHARLAIAGQPRVSGRLDGLYDLRVGPDVNVIVANGLGGGSLINAGVMAQPSPQVLLGSDWPTALQADSTTLAGQYDEVKALLGAQPAPSIVLRSLAMDRLGGPSASRTVDVTVAGAEDSPRGIRACNHCGDCATGCNFKAKLSVDVTLVSQARRKHPQTALQVVTGATVQTFRACHDAGYELEVWHTSADVRRHQPAPYRIRTRRLILSAGTLGSTELLMRAREDGLSVSSRLGERFSGNGDNVCAIYGMRDPAKAISREDHAHGERGIGPTITRMIDLRLGADDDVVVQDLAVPGPLRRLFEEVATTGAVLDSLTRADASRYRGDHAAPDPAGVDPQLIDRSMVVALIGHDAADGRLGLPVPVAQAQCGSLQVDWPEARNDARLDRYHDVLASLTAAGHPGAVMVANPAWRPLPKAIEGLLDKPRGPTITVHPLGGCVMADQAERGVVNDKGQVFRGPCGSEVYPDLLVLDGSIVPSSLGINPALTIATLARRAIRELRDQDWGWGCIAPLSGSAAAAAPLPTRPSFMEPPVAVAPAPTLIEVTEQMTASGSVRVGPRHVACQVKVQLRFLPVPASELVDARAPRRLSVDPTRSRFRIYAAQPPKPAWLPMAGGTGAGTSEPPELLWEAPLSGAMQLMRHAPSTALGRGLRTLGAFVLNRGLKDAWLKWFARDKPATSAASPSLGTILVALWRLATHAGDRRLIEYELELGSAVGGSLAPIGIPMAPGVGSLRAAKTLTYGRAVNPLNQLMQAAVLQTPQVAELRFKSPLVVDLPYFGRTGVPLLRVVSQADQPQALTDLASFMAYVARVMMPLHALTLRQPDPPAAEAPLPADPGLTELGLTNNPRLPHAVPGLPAPLRTLLRNDDGTHLLLTRYPAPASDAVPRPVLLIHGYSASGTTFVHPCLPGGGLVGALSAAGHDVWVLDLRSSAGMATGNQTWLFEQMACQDIPLAVEHVVQTTGVPRIDLVAHCMGAAMLSLGLFGQWTPTAWFDTQPERRARLAGRLGRIVFSQVGPAVVMAPTNTARAYAFSWLRHFLRLQHFEFLPTNPSAFDNLLDRLLSFVPYPREDYVRENPWFPPWKRTPWVRVRHRMDMLYGITFKLEGVSDEVLDAINDFFGPMSIETAAQVINFARHRLVTDHEGDGSFMTAERVQCIRHCRVLGLHAAENGLADVSTRDHLQQFLQAAEVQGLSVRLDGMGHQDSLIGTRAGDVYQTIVQFLGADEPNT